MFSETPKGPPKDIPRPNDPYKKEPLESKIPERTIGRVFLWAFSWIGVPRDVFGFLYEGSTQSIFNDGPDSDSSNLHLQILLPVVEKENFNRLIIPEVEVGQTRYPARWSWVLRGKGAIMHQ